MEPEFSFCCGCEADECVKVPNESLKAFAKNVQPPWWATMRTDPMFDPLTLVLMWGNRHPGWTSVSSHSQCWCCWWFWRVNEVRVQTLSALERLDFVGLKKIWWWTEQNMHKSGWRGFKTCLLPLFYLLFGPVLNLWASGNHHISYLISYIQIIMQLRLNNEMKTGTCNKVFVDFNLK